MVLITQSFGGKMIKKISKWFCRYYWKYWDCN